MAMSVSPEEGSAASIADLGAVVYRGGVVPRSPQLIRHTPVIVGFLVVGRHP
jgi:hypothetical protein